MNKQALIKRIENTRKELEAMEAELNIPVGVFMPAEGDIIYYWDNIMNRITKFTYDSTIGSHRRLLSEGDLFPTAEEAELNHQRKVVTQKLKELAEGWVPDWSDDKQFKFRLYYGCLSQGWRATWTVVMYHPNEVYFETHEKARLAIEELGSELDCLLPDYVS